MTERSIQNIETRPVHPGFLGRGHTAVAVIDGSRYESTDPFMLLMDDRLDLPGGPPVGGPHPHAGFETVTLVLQGDGHGFETGSLELMTAGKGIVHTEEITERTQMRILQLWLVLPPDKRWDQPFWQKLTAASVPVFHHDGSNIRVYSGSSQGLVSPLINRTPLTLVDYQITAGSRFVQEIEASHKAFVYALEGDLLIGDTLLTEGQTAWFNDSDEQASAVFTAGASGARFVFYSAKIHRHPVLAHGPFIADTQQEIVDLYSQYRKGWIPHLNDLPDAFKVVH